MGLFNSLLGNASETDNKAVSEKINDILVPGETVLKAFKTVRRYYVLSNKRIIFIHQQGITGKKVEITSIPYGKVNMFSKEDAGTFDVDSEIKIWILGVSTPVEMKFKKGSLINDVYKTLSEQIL